MSTHIVKSHNKTLLSYHLVFPVKYRKKVFTPEVTETLKEVSIGITERYEIDFIEIGTDEDHVHFLTQGVPVQSAEAQVRVIKSITSKGIFKRHPEIKVKLWGGGLDEWILCKYSRAIRK